MSLIDEAARRFEETGEIQVVRMVDVRFIRTEPRWPHLYRPYHAPGCRWHAGKRGGYRGWVCVPGGRCGVLWNITTSDPGAVS